MKKKIFLLTFCTIFTWACAVAQTQTGIVRTLEKSKRPSQGIDGVTVEILEYPNSIVSKKGGKFSFTLKNKKLGDAFKVSRVTKKGYTLVDKHLQGRKFSYSQTVPIEIVMVSDKQLANDKKQIEDKALAKAKKTYEAHIAELEQQFEKKTINEKAYYAERERLLNNYDNYIKLIDEMAERYALTDYKGLSDINREILECIENAELERADSLINSKGDFNQREQELRSQMEFNKVTAELLAQSQKDAEFKLNDLAQDYYNKFTILAANYKNDSAAYYLERRANLDTTNIHWQLQFGQFIRVFFENYPLALKYFQRGLQQARTQFGEQNEWIAAFYTNIGMICSEQEDYNKALEFHLKALKIWEKFDKELAYISYNNIGYIYLLQGDYTKALEFFQKTLNDEFSLNFHGNTNTLLGTTYNNIGVTYRELGDYNSSLEYLLKGLAFIEKEFGKEDYRIAIAITNIGKIYEYIGDYDKALEHYKKALKINEMVLGNKHSHTIKLLSNISGLYDKKGDYDKALEYYQNELDIYEKAYGTYHSLTAASYNNIGMVYFNMGDYNKALEYFDKTLKIHNKLEGEEHTLTAASYNNIGMVYSNMGDYDKALKYLYRALDINEKVLQKDYTEITNNYNNIGRVFFDLGNYEKAMECYIKALDIQKQELGEEHILTAKSYSNIGRLYFIQGDYDSALEYFFNALAIQKSVLSIDHTDVATSYYSIGIIYNKQRNYNKALEFFSLALQIFEKEFGESHSSLAQIYINIGRTYYSLNDYDNALKYLYMGLIINEKNLGNSHPKVIACRHELYIIKYKDSISKGKLQDFLSGHCLTAAVGDGGPAQQQGMEGEYVLLEFDDWREDSPVSLLDKNAEYKGKPKDIVVLKDGVISKHHFEDVMGVQLGVKEITKEERERINQLYKAWKSDQVLLDVWNSRKKDNSINKQSD